MLRLLIVLTIIGISITQDVEETEMPWAPKPILSHCVNQQRNYLTASILSIVFGGFGVDRLYLGYILTGLLKMLLAGVVVILTIVRTFYGFIVDPKKLHSGLVRTWYLFGLTGVMCAASQFVLWLIDVCLIMSDTMTDANGCPLQH
ncbi:hypothetical protein AKO1_004138 [Acrasis kona]|uniref:TM2 domain-containing protein n=1 Tax=Acrasis kona TaxID=1008807 RepID=A0AAW2ZCF3_9EUKA